MGREEVLKEIHAQLQLEKTVAISAVSGMGGIGKTELVTQYALQYKEEYCGGVCWLFGRGAELGTQIVTYARTYLNLNPPHDLDISDQVKYCWRNWGNGLTESPTPLLQGEGSKSFSGGKRGQVLIVCDDVQDYKQVEPYLPPSSSQFKVLLTSRNRPGASIKTIELDVLSPDASLELLRSLIGNERIEVELEQAQELCEWLGYLPLGLELVGQYLDKHRQLKIKELLRRLKKKSLEEKSLNPSDMTFTTAQRGVLAAIELSWEDLPTEAKKLGCFLSLFAPAVISWEWVERCWVDVDSATVSDGEEFLETSDKDDEFYFEKLREWQQYFEQQGEEFNDLEEVEERLDNWLEEKGEELQVLNEDIRDTDLVNRSLLEEIGDNQYRLHQLLREFFKIKLKEIEEADEYKQKLCKLMIKIASSLSQTPTLKEIEAVTLAIPHLTEIANNLIDWVGDEELPWVYEGLNRFYQGQGIYQEAERWMKQGVKETRKRLGSDHPFYASSLNNLAVLYYSQGRFTEAEPLYLEALEIRKRVLGSDHPSYAASLNNLALLYRSQGRFTEAEPLCLEALKIRKRVLGIDHPSYASYLNNLALLYHSQGRFTEAEPFSLKALEITKRVLGSDHPFYASSLNNLAGLYYSQGRFTEAEPLYLEALEIAQRTLGEEHPTTQTLAENYKYCLILMLFNMSVEEALKKIPDEYHQDFLQQREDYLNQDKT